MKFRNTPPVLVVIGAMAWLPIAAFGTYVAFNRSQLSSEALQEQRLHRQQEQQKQEAIRRAQIQRAKQEEDQRRCMTLSKGEQFCCQVGERPDRREHLVLLPRIMTRVALLCCGAGSQPFAVQLPSDISVPNGCRLAHESYR